jgi:UDP-N-acetylglucosamine--N-acetylmuramyl-(pentapeptide) pyrophosphoryl-undecaprenol N-acetylglucosamine transferase
MTDLVATSFPDTPLPHARFIGLPVRQAIASLDRGAMRAEARTFFGLDPELPTLLVTGGSQGAQRINGAMADAAAVLAASGVQVLHVIGPKNQLQAPAPAGAPYVVLNYVDRMDLAYAAADLVLARSGSNTVTEVSSVGLPGIFCPLPIGNGEQALNARPVVDAGGGLLIADAELTGAWIEATVPPLAHDPERLATMSRAAASRLPAGADERLARMILEAATR